MSKQLQSQPKSTAAAAPTLTPAPTGLLQRKCGCGGAAGVTDQCPTCEQKRLAVQRRAGRGADAPAVPAGVREVLQSSGRPLESSTRSLMESRFGHDFGRVRVHTDEQAAASAREVNALAYTHGHDIVFDSGQYAPATPQGQRLLAHELAHVVQQNGAVGFLSHYRVSRPSDPAELEAERAAQAVVEDKPVPRLAPVAYSVLRDAAEAEAAGNQIDAGAAAPAQAPPAGPACARPINFTHGNPRNHGPDAIRIDISWGSSTGNLADLGSCTVREVVSYDPIPDPPFTGWNPRNPTILTVPGVDGAGTDTHSYSPGLASITKAAGTATAHQVYQFQCTGPGCSGNWEDFPGQSYTITREVFAQFFRTNPWRYRITKTGVGNPFNFSREEPIP